MPSDIAVRNAIHYIEERLVRPVFFTRLAEHGIHVKSAEEAENLVAWAGLLCRQASEVTSIAEPEPGETVEGFVKGASTAVNLGDSGLRESVATLLVDYIEH